MMGKFSNFEELNRYCREGIDFQKRKNNLSSSVLILAPHGGGIEPGTSELAIAIAGNDLPFYLFEGIRKSANQDLHIPSTRFNDPDCLELLRQCQTALVIHGCKGRESVVLVGGSEIGLRQRMLEALSSNGFFAQIGTNRYAGIWQKNICNRTLSGKGVQIEITTGLRRKFFERLQNRQGREIVSDRFRKFVSIIRDVIMAYA